MGHLGRLGQLGHLDQLGFLGLEPGSKLFPMGFCTIYCTGVTTSLIKDTGNMTGNKLRMTVIPSAQVCMLPLTVPSYFARVDMKYFYHNKF